MKPLLGLAPVVAPLPVRLRTEALHASQANMEAKALSEALKPNLKRKRVAFSSSDTDVGEKDDAEPDEYDEEADNVKYAICERGPAERPMRC
jgi:hypothetical protein